MNLLLLPGNSVKNRDWIILVQKELSNQFEKTSIHDYAHWKNGEKMIDFEVEKEALSVEVNSFSPYNVFAKSVGSVLAIQSIAEGIISPNHCLFMGLPLELITKLELPVAKWIQEIETPMCIVQNEYDPAGSFKNVEEYVLRVGNPNITVRMLEGNSTHDYDNFKEIALLAGPWLPS